MARLAGVKIILAAVTEMTTAYELKRALRDKSMRRALLEVLQEATKEIRQGYPEFPEPAIDDDSVERELHRILGIRKGFFGRIKEGLFRI